MVTEPKEWWARNAHRDGPHKEVDASLKMVPVGLGEGHRSEGVEPSSLEPLGEILCVIYVKASGT